MAPIIEIVTGANHNHPVIGVISDISQISQSLPTYQIRVYSPCADGNVTRWQTTFIGYYKTLDSAVSIVKELCR